MKYALFAIFFSIATLLSSQNSGIIPVQVKEKFSDFTLNDQNGKSVTLSELKGKKVMLVFIRGKVTPQVWCPICHYQYLEVMQAQKKQNFMEELNMEVFFVLPYSADSLDNWKQAFDSSIEMVEGWKNPVKDENTPRGILDWEKYCDEFFPHTFIVPRKLKLKIPVLIDENQELSKGLFLYKEEWGGTNVAQNIPTVFILDEEGVVQFKYHSQYTNDRPDMDYLIKYVKQMM